MSEERICCPKCKKSNTLTISVYGEVSIRAPLDETGEIILDEELLLGHGPQTVFKTYVGSSGETLITIIKIEKEEASIYCTSCSEIFSLPAKGT